MAFQTRPESYGRHLPQIDQLDAFVAGGKAHQMLAAIQKRPWIILRGSLRQIDKEATHHPLHDAEVLTVLPVCLVEAQQVATLADIKLRRVG